MKAAGGGERGDEGGEDGDRDVKDAFQSLFG